MTNARKLLGDFIHPFKRSNRDRGEMKTEEEDLAEIVGMDQKVFRYETLAVATKNFHDSHKLGEGGYGPVYRGKLGDGREIAVKKLAVGSRQGHMQFENEATLLSRVQHKNVVHLYGYCSHGDDRLLVYEYIPNQSLDKILFSPENSPRHAELNWQRRVDLMVHTARGLLYLHEGAHMPIIHRDIKAGNILVEILHDKWIAKLGDFGMARLFPEGETHVNTRVAGTSGYMAPEYLMHGYLSPKADVYSFGVVVIELVTGRRCQSLVTLSDNKSRYLIDWAWRLFKEGRTSELVDPTIRSTADPEQVALCTQIGLLCTQADPRDRPEMKRVAIIFSKKPSSLEIPSKPGIPGYRYQSRSHTSGDSLNSSRDSSSTPRSFSPAFTPTFASAPNANGAGSRLSLATFRSHGDRWIQQGSTSRGKGCA